MITATVAFVVIWFVAAAANMWIGVSQVSTRFEKSSRFFQIPPDSYEITDSE
jgi:hypothetical protein